MIIVNETTFYLDGQTYLVIEKTNNNEYVCYPITGDDDHGMTFNATEMSNIMSRQWKTSEYKPFRSYDMFNGETIEED